MGEPILMDVTLIFFEIRSWILTLNTLNTTDDISQVNSFPFLDLFFGSDFKSQVESSAAISWPLVGCLGCKSVFLLEMALESSLVGQGISPPLCEASPDFPTPTPLPAGSGGNLASTGGRTRGTRPSGHPHPIGPPVCYTFRARSHQIGKLRCPAAVEGGPAGLA